MDSASFILFALQIVVLLACALVFGELMRKIGQPAVLGEMIGGIVLGPTVFGWLAPQAYQQIFLASPEINAAREALIKLGMLFFLFLAGLEVDLGNLGRAGHRALLIGVSGTVIPILAGLAVAYLAPAAWWGPPAGVPFFTFALFLGLSLANSANPVIARILMDLDLLHEEIGVMTMTASIVDDLVIWILLSLILGQLSLSGAQDLPVTASAGNAEGASLVQGVALTALFIAGVLVIGRWLGPRALHWLRRRLSWPNGFIALTALVVLLVSLAAEKLGVHAFLGAFLAGLALSANQDPGPGEAGASEEARQAISTFIMSFFAPLYFVSIGLTTNFLANFDTRLVILILAVACASKIGAVLLGGRLSGMPASRRLWAVAFGLNARGATGIILASIGLEHAIINDRLYVTMVIMALATSLLAAPLIALLSPRQRP